MAAVGRGAGKGVEGNHREVLAHAGLPLSEKELFRTLSRNAFSYKYLK